MSTTYEPSLSRESRISRQLEEAPGSVSDDDLAYLRALAPLWYGRAKHLRDEAQRGTETKAQPGAPQQLTKEQCDAFHQVFNAFVFGKHETDDALNEAGHKCLDAARALPQEVVIVDILCTFRSIDEKNLARNARLDALEAKVADLEARPKGLDYCGGYQRALTYKRHQGVSHQGSLYVCVADVTREIPGSSQHWQLCAKAVADGRDLR